MNELLLQHLRLLGLTDLEISDLSTEDNIKWANEYLDAFGISEQVLKNTAHSLINAKRNKAQKGWEDRSAKQNKEYLHWFEGADDRWRQSIKNKTNPVVGLNKTVVPAAVVAAAKSFGPALYNRVLPHAINAIYDTVKNPSLWLPAAANFTKGLAGYHLVEDGTKALTGEGFADKLSAYTGLSPFLTSFLNPGTFAYKVPVEDIVKFGVNFYKPFYKKIIKTANFPQRVKHIDKLYQDATNELYKTGDALDIAQEVYRKTPISLGTEYKQMQRALDLNSKLALTSLNNKSYNTSKNYRPSVIDFNKVYESGQWPNLIKKYPDLEGLVFIQNGIPYIKGKGSVLTQYVKIGDAKIPKFGTDDVVEIKIDGLSTGIPLSNFSTRNTTYLPEKQFNLESTNSFLISPNYYDILEHNINYILLQIPGSKAFGSAVGARYAGLPTIAQDYDLFITDKDFNSFRKKHPYERFTTMFSSPTPATYIYQLDNGKYGKSGDIDLNIIYTGEDGMATGLRALELFRQFFPDDYQKALLLSEYNKTPIKINKTPEELINVITPTKTVLDAFESSKSKHLPRSLVYLQEGDPKIVGEAIDKYFESFLGSNARHVPVDLNQLTNPQANLTLLLKLNLPKVLDLEKIAQDPQKMRNILQLYWIQNSTYGRGILTNNFKDNAFKDNAVKYLTEMRPNSGHAAGPGLNTVLFGDSGFGPVYGVVLMDIPGVYKGMTPFELYTQLQKHKGFGVQISDELLDKINKILQTKYPFVKLNNNNPSHQELRDLFTEIQDDPEYTFKIGDILDINGIETGKFGTSTYFGGVRNFNNSNNVIRFISTNMYDPTIRPVSLDSRWSSSYSRSGSYIPTSMLEIQSSHKHVPENQSSMETEWRNQLALSAINRKSAKLKAKHLAAKKIFDDLSHKSDVLRNRYFSFSRKRRLVEDKIVNPLLSRWIFTPGLDFTRRIDLSERKLWDKETRDFIFSLEKNNGVNLDFHQALDILHSRPVPLKN